MRFLALIFLCFLKTTYASYDEGIAKNKLLPMAAAAYANASVSECINNTFTNGQLIKQYHAGFLLDKYYAIQVLDNDDKAIIIAYGGSSTFTDLVIVDPANYYKTKTPFVGGGNVSQYIYNSWKNIWDAGIQDDLLSAKNANPSYQLWLTGHNIGGSFASLTAAYVLKLGFFTSSQVYLITFGQPRTGDNAFAVAHDQLVGRSSYRITHRQDPIPHEPSQADDGYVHHQNEIFYNNNMTVGDGYAECDADESSSCSDGNLVDLSISDHRHYFNVEIAKYGHAGCQSD